MRARLRRWLEVDPAALSQRGALLALHGGAGAVLVAFMLSAGLHGGLGPYLEELGAASVSLGRLGLYTLGVLGYAVAVELALRGVVQPWLGRRWGRWAGVLGAALLYGALHLHHSAAGVVYACGVGAWVGWVRSRGAPLWVFPLWHLQWDLAAIGATLGAALVGPGAPREAVDFAYKATLVESGRLQRDPARGWLDASHYFGAQRRVCAVWAALDRGEDEVTLRAEQVEASGARRVITTRLALVAPPLEAERLPLAAALVWQATREEEQAQAEAPLWTALRLSAWSFEDLPSVQAGLEDVLDHPASAPQRCAALAQGEVTARPIPGALPPGEAAARWEVEGRDAVQRRVTTWTPAASPRGVALERLLRFYLR